MKDLGKNITAYRKKAGITQEHLAELMHVSVSAVSQWETGKTLPDISAVPVLCHVLSVSADELLNIDQEKKEQEIQNIKKEAEALIFHHHLAKAEKLLTGALKRYPNRHDIMDRLMSLYRAKADDNTNPNAMEDCRKAIRYGERILQECTDDNARISAKQVLCRMYFKLGEEQKAGEIAWTLPSMFSGRENMLCFVSSGKSKAGYTQSLAFQTLFMLYNAMVFNMPIVFPDGIPSMTDDEQLTVIGKYETILATMFEDGDYGFFHTQLQGCSVFAAKIYAKRGDAETAMERLKNAADHAEATLNMEKDKRHTSVLFRGSTYGEFGTANGNNMTAELLNHMRDEVFDFMCTRKDFKTLEKRLSATAETKQ